MALSRLNGIATTLKQPLCKDDLSVELADAIAPYRLPPDETVDVILLDNPLQPAAFEVITLGPTADADQPTLRSVAARALDQTETPTMWPAGTAVRLALSVSNFSE
ncbi:MAG: hypothetical protein AAF417_15005 [Pseudomonadota bacterium]